MNSLDLYLVQPGTRNSQYLVMENPLIPPFIPDRRDVFHQTLSDNSNHPAIENYALINRQDHSTQGESFFWGKFQGSTMIGNEVSIPTTL